MVHDTELRAGGLRLPALLMQAITHIAPAVGLITSMQFIAQNAGNAAPLAFLIAFVIMMTLGLALTQLAKHITSAGGYYTYVSRTISPRAGFLASWLYFLYDPFGGLLNMVIMGWIVQAILQSGLGITFPWWLTVALYSLAVSGLTYFGVEISGRAMLILGVFEMAVVILLSLTGIINPGKGGVNLLPFSPASAPSPNGLALGVIFCIFAFTGFESVAPMAEESQSPRRTLPRAIIWSIIIMGLFYTLCCWALMLGWGTDRVTSLIKYSDNTANNPIITLAKHLWPGLWWFVVVAMLNSVLAVSIACQNAVTRVYFAMGRSGTLPKALAKVHPVYKTPSNAILFQTAINIVVGVGLGLWLGPLNEFALLAAMLTLAMILVYSAGNLGVFLLYYRERRNEFNIFLHAACPLISTVALFAVGYFSNVPLPSGVLGWVPFIVFGWLIVGIVLVYRLSRSGKEEWLENAVSSAREVEPARPT